MRNPLPINPCHIAVNCKDQIQKNNIDRSGIKEIDVVTRYIEIVARFKRLDAFEHGTLCGMPNRPNDELSL